MGFKSLFLLIVLINNHINFGRINAAKAIVTTESGDEDNGVKSDYGEVTALDDPSSPSTSPKQSIQFLWKVADFWQLLDNDFELIFSPKFYVTRPGYRMQLMLIPNTTYSDNVSYIGVFFRLVTGTHDAEIEWPYKLKTVLEIVDQEKGLNSSLGSNSTQDEIKDGKEKDYSFTVTPNSDPCRLRSAFLRPSSDNDNTPRPDGCGNRRHISLDVLHENEKYVNNGTLYIKATIFLFDHGQQYKKSTMAMKYNHLVSNFEWVIKDYPKIQKQSLDNDNVVVLTSEPFYTHTSGYLMQMYMTLLPKKKAFAVSIALAQGDHDRYLQWPFPYEFEVAIVDQSPGYWRRDYSISMTPSTSECGTTPFFHPSGFPDFCFITVQSVELLTLTHYNFIVNGTLKIRFTTKFERFANRKHASLKVHDKNLVSEYSWLIPAIEGKIEKYDFVKGKAKLLASEEFYTNGQGYLMQLILTLNHNEHNEGVIGLELALLEGEYDGTLEWPFNQTYELSIIRQRTSENGIGETMVLPPPPNGTYSSGDVTLKVIPSLKANNCTRHSFQRPIERNPPCGSKSLITFERVSRSREFIKLGNLQVKARIYLNKLSD